MEPVFNEIALENFLDSAFKTKIAIKSIIADRIPVGRSANASVFLSEKGVLYALIIGQGKLNFGEIKKIVKNMNLRAENFLPPRGEKDYFEQAAIEKFNEVFPGRYNPKEEDLRYYRTLVRYNPALVKITEVTSGAIAQYDPDAVDHWRPSIKFVYRRIKTS